MLKFEIIKLDLLCYQNVLDSQWLKTAKEYFSLTQLILCGWEEDFAHHSPQSSLEMALKANNKGKNIYSRNSTW